jgi:hypothetical protein
MPRRDQRTCGLTREDVLSALHRLPLSRGPVRPKSGQLGQHVHLHQAREECEKLSIAWAT